MRAIFGLVLFGLCVVYITKQFHWRDALAVVAHANLARFLIGGTLSILAYWLLRTLRWSILLTSMGIQISFSTLYACTAVSLSLAIVTPLQSGELLKVELLKKYGNVARLPGYGVFLVERVIDIFVVTTMALASVSINSLDLPYERRPLLIALGALACATVLGAYLALKMNVPGKFGKLLLQLKQLALNVKKVVAVTLVTIGCWTVVALGWQICLLSLPVQIRFDQAIALTSIMAIVNVLSIIPGALGVSEVGTTQFLSLIGNTAVTAQAGAIVLRLYGILILMLGVAHLFIWRVLNRQAPHATRRNHK